MLGILYVMLALHRCAPKHRSSHMRKNQLVQLPLSLRHTKRIAVIGSLPGFVLALSLVIQHYFAKPDLLGFDPNNMARTESGMWKNYYEGKWGQLGWKLFSGACTEFGFSWWDGLHMSSAAGRSALYFRKDGDDPRCLPLLVDYYQIIKKASRVDFDPARAASLELQWWKQRRALVAPEEYAKTIANLSSLIYGCPPDDLLPAARLRAQAMAYRDALRNAPMRQADWDVITSQLDTAYTQLKKTIAR